MSETERRLDAVSELASSDSLLDDVQQNLKNAPKNPDMACTGLAAACQGSARSLQTGIQSMLWLRYKRRALSVQTVTESVICRRELLVAGKDMKACMRDAQSELLQSAAEHCSNAESQQVLNILHRVRTALESLPDFTGTAVPAACPAAGTAVLQTTDLCTQHVKQA